MLEDLNDTLAKSKNNLIMRNTSGAIGKQVVFKVINGETIAAKYLDMSQVEYNKEQLEYRQLFAEGVSFGIHRNICLSELLEWFRVLSVAFRNVYRLLVILIFASGTCKNKHDNLSLGIYIRYARDGMLFIIYKNHIFVDNKQH